MTEFKEIADMIDSAMRQVGAGLAETQAAACTAGAPVGKRVSVALAEPAASAARPAMIVTVTT